MKTMLRWLMIGLVAVGLASCGAQSNSITLQKTEYAPGDDLQATFMATADLPKDAWIGVIPAEATHGTEEDNDKVDVSYMYLSGKTEGSVGLKAPMKPGKYDLRLNESDQGGKELATSVEFNVTGSTAMLDEGMTNSNANAEKSGSITLTKTEYAAGEKLEGTYTSEGLPTDAWLGIIPSDTPHGTEEVNDQHDVSYVYLSGKASGNLDGLMAPTTPGQYDVRLNESDQGGMELGTASFTVK